MVEEEQMAQPPVWGEGAVSVGGYSIWRANKKMAGGRRQNGAYRQLPSEVPQNALTNGTGTEATDTALAQEEHMAQDARYEKKTWRAVGVHVPKPAECASWSRNLGVVNTRKVPS